MLAPSTPVVHLELHTGDLQRARAFYAQLCDWHPDRVDTRHGSYHTLELGGGLGGGIVECATKRPLWLPYVEVSEIGAATERARDLGRRRPARGPRGPGRLAQRRRHAGRRRDRLLAGQAMRRPLRRRVLAVCHPTPVATSLRGGRVEEDLPHRRNALVQLAVELARRALDLVGAETVGQVDARGDEQPVGRERHGEQLEHAGRRRGGPR